MDNENTMTNGDTTAQPATGQEPDANEQLAIAQPTGDTEGQVAADPNAPADEPMIPKSRLDEKEAKVQEAEAKLAERDQTILMMQTAQQYAPQPQPVTQPTPTAPAPANPYGDLEDDDYISVGAAKQAQQAQAAQIHTAVDKQIQIGLFQASHQDYAEVVGSTNPATGQFQYSQKLTEALTKNPTMAHLLQSQIDPLAAMQLAYQLANSEKPIPTAPAPNAVHLAQNAQNTASAQTAVMPGSAVGGSGEINSDAATENMSEAEFEALNAKVMSGQFG